MDKELFTYSHTVEFNNKYFMVMNGENTPLYLLEIKDNKLQYPTFEDYAYYLNKHMNSKRIYNILSMNDIKTKILKFKPKVLFRNTLIAVTAALALAGCKSPDNSLIQQGFDYSMLNSPSVNESYDELHNYVLEQTKTEFAKVNHQISDCGVNTNELKNFYGIYHVYPSGDIACEDFDEFKRIMGITSQPTYDDVQELIENNETIPEDLKTIIINHLNKMRVLFPKLDLSVLYENYKLIKFEEMSEKDIQMYSGGDSLAHFETGTNVIRYSRNPSQFSIEYIMAHEALGHPLNEFCSKVMVDGKEVTVCFGSDINFVTMDAQYNAGRYETEFAMSEAYADAVALSLTNEKIDNTNAYCGFHEYINILRQILGVDLDELLNMKGIDIYKALASKGLNNILSNHSKLEAFMLDYNTGMLRQGNRTYENIIKDMLIDWKSAELRSGDQEVINEAIEEIKIVLSNRVYEYIDFAYKQNDKFVSIDKYDPNELIEYFNEYAKDIVKSR